MLWTNCWEGEKLPLSSVLCHVSSLLLEKIFESFAGVEVRLESCTFVFFNAGVSALQRQAKFENFSWVEVIYKCEHAKWFVYISSFSSYSSLGSLLSIQFAVRSNSSRTWERQYGVRRSNLAQHSLVVRKQDVAARNYFHSVYGGARQHSRQQTVERRRKGNYRQWFWYVMECFVQPTYLLNIWFES